MGDEAAVEEPSQRKRDAFSLLLSQSQSQKKARRSPGAAGAAAGAGAGAAAHAPLPLPPRSYASCPVCDVSIPSAFAEAHVAACLDRQEAAARAKETKEAREEAAAAARAKQEAAAAAKEAEAAAAAPAPAAASNGPPPPSSSKGGKSAFDALRAGSEAQRPNSHVFFLEHVPAAASSPSSWRWHWWPRHGPGAARCPPPPAGSLPEVAWSAVVSIGGGGRGGGSGNNKAAATEIHLRTNLPSGDGADVSWDNPLLASNPMPGKPRWRGSPSALKSALQKNVRLCRPGPAVRAALALLKQGPDLKGQDELLRRLPVICVEDGLLHPAFPLLVWLMMARGKGFVLGGTAGNAVLRVVHQLAAVGVRDYLPPMATAAGGGGGGGDEEAGGEEEGRKAPPPPARPPLSLADADARLMGLAPAEAALVKALLVRAAFGGMGCDVAMLRGYAAGWAARFAAAAADFPAGAGGAAGSSAGAGVASDEWWSAPPPPLEAVLGGQQQQQQQQQQQEQQCSPWLAFMRACYSAAAACPMDPPPPPPPYAAAPAPAAPPRPTAGPPPLTLVGPITARDVPLSAIDHHVSDIVDHILMPPPAPDVVPPGGAPAGRALALAVAATPAPSAPAAALERLVSSSWGSEADPRGLVSRALWLFRSCASRKALLPLVAIVRGGAGAGGPPSPPPPLLLPALPAAVADALRTTSAGAALAAEVDADAAQRERLAEFWVVAAPVADAYARSYLARRFF